eukprot:Nitzschia sp. Nitz4//scaffold1_size375055//9179//10704//NITZ4_000205-RA/size375055-augustus-gene-0.703-mRNA-1//-1//CDS//3329540832//7726//frame0
MGVGTIPSHTNKNLESPLTRGLPYTPAFWPNFTPTTFWVAEETTTAHVLLFLRCRLELLTIDNPTQPNKATMYSNTTLQRSGKVIIVDWDDTILPSTFVDRWRIENFKDLPLHFQNLLGELSRCADRFLEEASKYGEVIIITNSDDGWVKFSAERYCPQLLPVVDKYRVVSARTRYEKFYPGQPLCWKAAAFAHEVNEIYETLRDDTNSCGSMEMTDVSSASSMESDDDDTERREIISFGDSGEERTATNIVSKQLEATPKSVMFMSNPSPLQIIGQLHMLTDNMHYVCGNDKSLDLKISSEQADRFARSYLKKYRIHYDHNIVPNYVPATRHTNSARA